MDERSQEKAVEATKEAESQEGPHPAMEEESGKSGEAQQEEKMQALASRGEAGEAEDEAGPKFHPDRPAGEVPARGLPISESLDQEQSREEADRGPAVTEGGMCGEAAGERAGGKLNELGQKPYSQYRSV